MVSDIVIGTADFCGVNITACEVPRTGSHITLKNEGPTGVGISLKGYITTTVATTWKLKKGGSAQTESSNYL